MRHKYGCAAHACIAQHVVCQAVWQRLVLHKAIFERFQMPLNSLNNSSCKAFGVLMAQATYTWVPMAAQQPLLSPNDNLNLSQGQKIGFRKSRIFENVMYH